MGFLNKGTNLPSEISERIMGRWPITTPSPVHRSLIGEKRIGELDDFRLIEWKVPSPHRGHPVRPVVAEVLRP